MKLNYYVLGKKDNEMLKQYLEKYYVKLKSMLQELYAHGFLTNEINNLLKIENRDFILNPDQSSIINLLYNEIILKQQQNLGNIQLYEMKLKKELVLFLDGDYEKLTMNQGQSIAGTNIRLTNIDNNPYNVLEAHPEHSKSGAISGNWGEKTENEWLEIYEKSFILLKNVDIGIYTELNQIIKKIIPLGTAKGMHNSASYKECIGHLYMGYTIDSSSPEINNLEAIIHESSHNKLNLIMQFDKIILNDKSEKYYSAIRPDARHIHGVFLGYHAFAPTMYILMKSYLEGYLGNDNYWLEKIVLFYIKTKLLQKVIKKYANLTDLGKEISAEIDYVILLMDELVKKISPSKDIIKIAKERQEKHFQEVSSRYSYLNF